MQQTCPLCGEDNAHVFHEDKRRSYFRCSQCLLVFVPEYQHLSLAAEKAIYELHQNDRYDPRYRAFLSRAVDPLRDKLNSNACGLDFGCGPGSAIVPMMHEYGFQIEQYDPVYADDPGVLESQYEYLMCTEVVEHFRQPSVSFDVLFSLLQPRGVMAIMTKMVLDRDAFSRWHYKNDLTHISFFSRETFQWLAKKYQASLEFYHNDVVILQKC